MGSWSRSQLSRSGQEKMCGAEGERGKFPTAEASHASYCGKMLPSSSSFDNIEQLSADLIARGTEAANNKNTTSLARQQPAGEASPISATKHGARSRSRTCESQPTPVSCNTELLPRSRGFVTYLQGLLASSRRDSDDIIEIAALPVAHSRWLFGVSWLCFLTSLQCLWYGK